jgi:mRNA interferase MazF
MTVLGSATRQLALGDILVVRLPIQVPPGHEQEGYRPVVVVGLPDRVGVPRYPMFIGVPFTTSGGTWSERSPELYPLYRAGRGGLPKDSVAILDHLRCIDARRAMRCMGTLTPADLAPIVHGLSAMFAF